VLTSSFTLLAGISSLYLFGGFMLESIKKHTVQILGTLAEFEMTPANIYTLSLKLFFLFLTLITPLVITIIMTSLLVNVAQDNGRFDFSAERLSFDLSKLSPLKGLGRIFNKDALVEMLKSFIKLMVVAYIAYQVLRDESTNIAFLAESDVEGIIGYVGHVAFSIITHTCGILLIIGLFDLLYVKWRYLENLKMTKQEVKDEHKDTEGNPEIKGKIRRMQFQMAKRRMTTIIPTADVVITNPTHYAVALKYERERMVAPVVIAKGVDVMAEAIKKIAKEHRIVLVENRFLARELYDQVKENEPIPESLYAAVAEVLAYVYRLKGLL
jgi:flagellar biosynthetic protein FlhB